MFYLVQEDCFKERHTEILINNFKRLELGYEIVKVIPFACEIWNLDYTEYIPHRHDVIVMGGTSMSKACPKYGFKPGTFLNENHDVRVYGPQYGDNMLNNDGVVIDLFDPVPFDGFFFARPTDDDKQFTGKVFTPESWAEWIEKLKRGETMDGISKNILVAPEKEIYQEIRCWVIKGKVITTSQYTLGSQRGFYKNMDYEKDITDFAQSMVDIYQVSDAFVLDICRTEEGFKIVEVNCINSAGFYDMDSQKLLMVFEENFNK